ncbi:leucine-rich repeat-containing protein 45 isoform X1 [Nilaparvata lugens]|uniref:leucine-rich repeat-containing protein 45 isoform X1 n=1 Tax=Nilaparvata lugens TaxID=108931 RepID=UPI00193D383A|nr:leucine-rich repeat-containing protein 45 isoform X1 [Nilaparvata lugens]XP_039280167.1 leucine-rich repeat-containing protein 45 isoform X1 [Nilaparvata lugens]XP_039280168.1 leucine-rich repeat-containing protein 45 isoform X1 [Nilaparvata lugens]XP_039280169.1 leucine-rich repeat-containing protein 45 isoform X1 [Nilaparvata lugens]XP_039280170.1 leucine-rich repeat-containing protein 45 isoform X1 [Nilaparvata lugens]XP_039280171.1 leucine-rich repeat-containing protein 45 isoform X1 [N
MGPKGAVKIGDSLEYTKTIRNLDLSCNELEDVGLQSLVTGLGYNKSIKNLNLSNNKFTHLSCWQLAEIFKENSNILDVDISWNNIMNKEQGIKFFLNSLCKLNETLENINFAWSGLNGENVPAFFKSFLARFKFIKHLDLSNNRLQGKMAIDHFSRGVNSSTSLETLDLSYNPFQLEHVMNFISRISKARSLKKLIFSNFWLPRKMYKAATDIHERGGPSLVVEGLLGVKEEEVSNEVAQTLLLKRAHYLGLKPKKKKRRKEFAHFLLKLKEDDKLKQMKKKAFLKLFNEQKLLIDDKMENEFVKRFKVLDRKNAVDLPLILELYMKLFPNTALPKKKGPATATPGDIVNQLLEKLIDNAVGKKSADSRIGKRSKIRQTNSKLKTKSMKK